MTIDALLQHYLLVFRAILECLKMLIGLLQEFQDQITPCGPPGLPIKIRLGRFGVGVAVWREHGVVGIMVVEYLPRSKIKTKWLSNTCQQTSNTINILFTNIVKHLAEVALDIFRNFQ